MCALLLPAFVLFVVYAGIDATMARASIPQPPQDIQAPVPDPAAPGYSQPAQPGAADSSQSASTGQTASSDASATQQQPINVVVSVRINSPGDDGPISQRNIVTGVSDASNDAATNQSGRTGGGADQDASTTQQAGSTANASQQQPTNIVVVVRINSPGKNGPITQDNVDVAVANAGNASATEQGGSGGTSGAAPSPDPVPAAVNRQQPARSSAPAVAKRHPVRKRATVAPRRNAPAAASRPASGPPAAPAAASSSSSYGSAAQAPAAKPVVKHPKAQGKRHPAPAARQARSTRRTVPQRLAGGAVNLLHSFPSPIRTFPSPIRTDEATERKGSSSFSGAVVSTLLVVLAAVAAFLAWPHLSRRLQLPGLRWRG